MRELELTCVGMRYAATPATLQAMNEACPMMVELRREPENIHDENAIGIWCREKPWKGMRIGYVSREVAAEIAPRMDRGKVVFHESWLLWVDDEHGMGGVKLKMSKPPLPKENAGKLDT